MQMSLKFFSRRLILQKKWHGINRDVIQIYKYCKKNVWMWYV
jgi:hypothetical protein